MPVLSETTPPPEIWIAPRLPLTRPASKLLLPVGVSVSPAALGQGQLAGAAVSLPAKSVFATLFYRRASRCRIQAW